MRKKILAVALAATMVFGLVGCGSSSQSSNNSTKANNETQATEDFNPDKIEDSKTMKISVRTTEKKLRLQVT